MGMFRNLMIASGTRRRDPLYGIHYVADWDGKDLSNEEDEPMRSQWVDKKTGKVIELHNFGYAGMSGWGGCGTDMSKLVPHNDIAVTETTYMSLKCTRILKQSNSPISEWGPNRIASGPATVRFRITGVSDNLSIRFESYTIGDGLKTLFTSTGDGVYTAEISDPAKYYRWIAVLPADAVYPVNCNVTIEQLPLYPGALVGDGIDDYGQSAEAIDEEVGTVLLHYRRLVEVPNRWGYYTDGVNQNRLIIAYYQNSPYFYSNLIAKHNDGNIFIGELSQAIAGNTNLHLMANTSNAERGQVAIYRLILIREQLNETQIAYLVNKVQKEYNDWCKANGYDYAIING